MNEQKQRQIQKVLKIQHPIKPERQNLYIYDQKDEELAQIPKMSTKTPDFNDILGKMAQILKKTWVHSQK